MDMEDTAEERREWLRQRFPHHQFKHKSPIANGG